MGDPRNVAEAVKAAVIAPLENFDVLHEILNVIIAVFWFLAYAALLQSLRRQKRAVGLSLQTLFALFFSEANLLLLAFTAYAVDFNNVEFRTIRVVAHSSICLLSLVVFLVVAHRFHSSYEYDKDSFGMNPLNIVGLGRTSALNAREGCFCGLRYHWITLYVYAAIFGALLQRLRRHALPHWFGFWECTVDMVKAMALIPQFHMIAAKRKWKLNSLIARFVMFMLCAKITSLVYWLSDVWFHGALPGRGIAIFSDSLNALILLHFSYHAIVAQSKAGLQGVCLPV